MTRGPTLALSFFLFGCIACSGEQSGTPSTPDAGGDAGGAGDGAVSQNCTPPAQPSNSPWRFVRPSVPTFSWITTPDPGGRAFFIVDGAGNWRRLLRTDDEGQTWCQITTPVTPEGLFLQGRFLHLAGTSLAAGGPSAVYRSLDRGRNWQALPGTLPGVPRRLFALDDDGRQLVALVPSAVPSRDGPGLWESLNGGGTWKALPVNLAAVGSPVADWEMIARDTANPSRWIARASVGLNAFGGVGGAWNLVESLDDGITWRMVESPGGPTHTDGLLTSGLAEIVTTADRAIWRRQPGQPWQPFGTTGALSNAVLLGAFDQVVYAHGRSAESGRNQTMRRNDSGSWTPISLERDEQAIPLAPGHLMAAGQRGLRLTDDDGLAWRRMGHFLTGQLLTARAPGSRRLYLARFFALSHSDDGGQTWSDHPLTEGSFFDVSPDPVDPAVVHAALNTPTPSPGVFTATLHRSGDGGMTWTPVPVKLDGMEAQQVRAVLAMATSPPALLVTTELGLLRSEDGGATWANVLGPVASRLSGSAADPNTVLAVAPDFLMVSVNGGRAWAQAPFGQIIEAQLHPTNPDLLYVIQNTGLQGWRLSRYSLAQGTVSALHEFRSAGGQPTRNPLSDRLLAVTPDSRILLRDQLGKLWESPDDGVTWIEPGDRGSTVVRSILLDPAVPGSLLVTADGGLLRLPLQ